jgi:hypothetical protein
MSLPFPDFTIASYREKCGTMSRVALEKIAMSTIKTTIHLGFIAKIRELAVLKLQTEKQDLEFEETFRALNITPREQLTDRFKSLKTALVLPLLPDVGAFVNMSDADADACIAEFNAAGKKFHATHAEIADVFDKMNAHIAEARGESDQNLDKHAERPGDEIVYIRGRKVILRTGIPMPTYLPDNIEVGQVVIVKSNPASSVSTVMRNGVQEECLRVHTEPTADGREWVVCIPKSMMSARKSNIKDSTFGKKCIIMCLGNMGEPNYFLVT